MCGAVVVAVLALALAAAPVAAAVDGRRTRTVRGHRVRRVVVRRPRATRFRLRIEATTARHAKVVTSRSYSGCRRSRARVVIHRGGAG
jgi:hypothetical protein